MKIYEPIRKTTVTMIADLWDMAPGGARFVDYLDAVKNSVFASSDDNLLFEEIDSMRAFCEENHGVTFKSCGDDSEFTQMIPPVNSEK